MSADQGTADAQTKVFVSYSRRDIAFVDRLAAALEPHQITPTIDRTEIYAFEDWWKRIEALIGAADTVIFVLSPDAIASDICHKEVDYALYLKKRFAPIVCRSVAADMAKVPAALGDLNFIFFDEPHPFDEALVKLVEALRTDIGWIRNHTQYGLDAGEWAKAGRPGGLLLRSPALEEAEHWIAARPPGAPVPSDEMRAFILESRRGTTRRRNVLTGSLGAGLVIAIGLAGVAFWQRSQAIEQRRIAERNYDAAAMTVDGLMSNLVEGLRDVAGMRVATIRKILETARGTIDQLFSSVPNDPQLRALKASMFVRFAVIYAKTGDLTDARQSVEDGLAIFRELSDREDFDTRRFTFISLEQLGGLQQQFGDSKGALETFNKNLRITRKLAAEAPHDAKPLVDLAAALLDVGDAKDALDDRAGAFAAYRESLDIDRTVAARPDADAQAKEHLAFGLGRMAGAVLRAGDAKDAMAKYQEGLGISQVLANSDPDNRQWQSDLAFTLDAIGSMKQASKDDRGALTAFQQSVDIRRRRAAQDSDDIQAQRDVASSLTDLGDVKSDLDDAHGALEAFQECLGIDRKLAARGSGDLMAQRNLSSTLVRVGDIELDLGDAPRALASFQEALAADRKLAVVPGDTHRQNHLTTDLGRIGSVDLQLGDKAGALAAYQEALDMDLKSPIAETVAGQSDLSTAWGQIGHLKLTLGDKVGALAAYQASLDINRKLLAKPSHVPGAQRNVLVALNNIGDIKRMSGDGPGALATYTEGLDLLHNPSSLGGSGVSSSTFEDEMLLFDDKIADVKRQVGDRRGALAAAGEALGIRRKQAARDAGDMAAQHDVAADLAKVGGDKAALGDSAGALAAFQESLDIRRKIATVQDTVARQEDVLASFLQIGDLNVKLGNRPGAFDAFRDGVGVARTTAALPEAAKGDRMIDVQWNLAIALMRLASVSNEAEARYREALAICTALDQAGQLAPARKPSLAFLNRRLAAIAAPKP